MKYSIVIPTYNHCNDFLKPCIESIFKYSNLADIELIVSANGCTDETSQYLDQVRLEFNKLNLAKNFQVAWSDSPSGYPKATNDGIRLATTDKIVLLNNDCILLEQEQNQWLTLLEKPFEDFPQCGISCVVKDYSKVMAKEYAVFFCVMIDKKLFDEIGYLNEEYGTGSGEDMEFCVKAQEKGYELHQIFEKTKLNEKYFGGQFPIYHFGEGTVHDESLVSNWESNFLKNKIKLAKKVNNDWTKTKMTNDKKVGVITPVFNDTKHLFNAITTVKTQSVQNVIHYIYDDASTDGLQDALDELEGDVTVQVIRGEENKGQSFGRNTLIQKAIADGCEYIAFLDSDDFWVSPYHLEDSLSYLNDDNFDCDIVYSKPLFSFEDGKQTNPVNIPTPQMFVGKQLYHNNFIWISSVVCKKECVLNNAFDDSLNSVEDWDMWIRLFEQKFKFHDKQTRTVQYLVRETTQASLGNTKMALFDAKHKKLLKLKLHLACGHDYNDDYINVDLYAPDDAVCDVRFDVMKLPYEDNSVDEIKAFHIIEHFHFFEIQEVLKEWYRVLKPGGRLYMETPDFLETCRAFVEGSPMMPIEDFRVLLYGHFFAHPWVPGQTHKFLFTEEQMRTNLSWAGFKEVRRGKPASKYVLPETVNLFLNVEAFK
jgi:glycosyltransferase involved in cell wall biosynthesis